MPTTKQKEEKEDNEDLEAKQKLIYARKARLYFAKLSHKISITEPKVYPKSLEGLKALVDAIETELSSEGGIELAGGMFLNAAKGLERLTTVFNPLNLMLTGPAASLSLTAMQSREAWNDLVTEFAITYSEWFMVGPTKRLIGFVVQLVHTVDSANKEAMGSMRRADPADAAEASDL